MTDTESKKGRQPIVRTAGSLGPSAYAKLDRCSKAAEEWAAESTAEVAMRRSRRVFGYGLASTPVG